MAILSKRLIGNVYLGFLSGAYGKIVISLSFRVNFGVVLTLIRSHIVRPNKL